MEAQTWIPILSLIVAALAVFVGPFVSWRVAREQTESSLKAANKQIIAPMRQAWINSLRDLLAEFTATAMHYYLTGTEHRTDAEFERLTLLQHKVLLMLNPVESDHKDLQDAIGMLIVEVGSPGVPSSEALGLHGQVVDLSRAVLKREWNRVKEPLKLSSDGAA